MAPGTPPTCLKQAVISASAISLMYPAEEIPGYPREPFLDDLVASLTPKSAIASRGSDASRSTSPKRGWPSRSIPRAVFLHSSST